jgi:hypothetical protein
VNEVNMNNDKWLYDGLYRTRGEQNIHIRNSVGISDGFEYAYDAKGNVTHFQEIGKQIIPVVLKEHSMDLMERLDGKSK